MADVRLYDANGGQIGTAEVDEDPGREGVVEHGGKTYIWNQRNAQWREASGVVKVKGSAVEPVAPEAAPPPSAGREKT